MILGNVPKLHGLIGSGLLIAAAAVPIGCSDDDFAGCEASRTCPNETGTGGNGGEGTDTGGTSGSGASGRSGSGGSAGTSGSAGADDGGEGGTATGGRGGTTGEGGRSDDGGEGGAPEPPDTTPPTIVSVSPTDGATGVRADVDLVVTFSEPMDRVSTQAAYQSADIAAAAVTFSWNTESTVLTVNPNSDLAYADGNDLNVVARTFAAQVTDTAEDNAGNRLASNFPWSFRTLRRITQTFTTGSVRVKFGDASNIACTGVLGVVGDNSLNAGSLLLVSRDISALPEGIAVWEAATLIARQDRAEAAVYERFGPVMAYHMSVWPPETITWTTQYLRTLGQLSSDATLGEKSLDVLAALTDDYAHRGERNQMSQYRLSFQTITDADGVAENVAFGCDGHALRARYLVP